MKVGNGAIVFEKLIDSKTGQMVTIKTDYLPPDYIREAAENLADRMKEVIDEPQTEFQKEKTS